MNTVSLPPGIAAEQAQTRANVAVSNIKANAEKSEQIAGLVEDGARNINQLATRGTNVDITV